MNKKVGIYRITNIVNFKCYIGQTIDFRRRLNQHKNNLEKNKHINEFLQNSYNKHGKENFIYEIIEICDKSNLDDREKFWIDYYDSYRHGYNKTIGGNSNDGDKLRGVLPLNFNNNINNTDGDILELVAIVKLDKDYNFISEYISVNECARDNNEHATNITKCAKGKYKTCGGFIYMYKQDISDMIKSELIEFRKNQRDVFNYNESFSTKKVKVGLVDNLGDIIKIFNSISEASRELKLDASSITKVCKGRLKQTNGYVFVYM